MSNYNLYILQKQSIVSIAHFIDYWKKWYSYPNPHKYQQNIGLTAFEETHLRELFDWKNGMPLTGSGTKEKSFREKVLSKLSIINQYKKSPVINEADFNTTFQDVSAVWRIFLLHIIQPNVYPIYDQHIHRTYNFIHNLEWQSITNKIPDNKKLEFYFQTYLPFIKSVQPTNLKVLDEAFFAFGQFLNTGNHKHFFEN